MAKRKLSPERQQRRDSMKVRIFAAYQCTRLKVLFTRELLRSPQHYGEADVINATVLINPRHRYGDLVTVIHTLIHEAIHCLEPRWHHNKVYAVERDIAATLTNTERQRLLLLAVDNGFWRDC